MIREYWRSCRIPVLKIRTAGATPPLQFRENRPWIDYGILFMLARRLKTERWKRGKTLEARERRWTRLINYWSNAICGASLPRKKLAANDWALFAEHVERGFWFRCRHFTWQRHQAARIRTSNRCRRNELIGWMDGRRILHYSRAVWTLELYSCNRL